MGEQEELKQDLGMLNVSLMFLLLIIFAVLLSLWSALIQRRQLELALEGGDPSKVPPVEPIRCAGSAITVGCLGFFLCLALDTRRQAQAGGTPAAKRSAQVNVTASLLVLLAAILRLVDLQTVEQEQQTPLLEETTLPD
jgi:putative copper export protein